MIGSERLEPGHGMGLSRSTMHVVWVRGSGVGVVWWSVVATPPV